MRNAKGGAPLCLPCARGGKGLPLAGIGLELPIRPRAAAAARGAGSALLRSPSRRIHGEFPVSVYKFIHQICLQQTSQTRCPQAGMRLPEVPVLDEGTASVRSLSFWGQTPFIARRAEY